MRRVETLRNLLGPLLKEYGWSERDLALRTGLSRHRINRLKNRRIRPTVRDALLIGRAFGRSVERIFSGPPAA